MNPDKYGRTVTLICPTCGGFDFEHIEVEQQLLCKSCGREVSREELVKENSEIIQAQVSEIKSDILKDIKSQFKNNKFIKIK